VSCQRPSDGSKLANDGSSHSWGYNFAPFVRQIGERKAHAKEMLQQLTTDYWDIALKRFAKLNF
jgi:hypothetical protein